MSGNIIGTAVGAGLVVGSIAIEGLRAIYNPQNLPPTPVTIGMGVIGLTLLIASRKLSPSPAFAATPPQPLVNRAIPAAVSRSQNPSVSTNVKIVPAVHWREYVTNAIHPINDDNDIRGVKDIVIINGQAYLPDTIAEDLAKRDDQYVRQGGERIKLWDNVDQFLDLLRVIHSLTNDESLKLRLDGYEAAKEMIKEFDDENPITFAQLLGALYLDMSNTKDNYGANTINEGQWTSFTTYVKIRGLLPDNIREVVFPFYSYSAGDTFCVNSASRVFKEHVERLGALSLIRVDAHQEQSSEVIKQSLQWFSKRFPLPESETVQNQNTNANLIREDAVAYTGDYRNIVRMSLSLVLENRSTDVYESIAYALQIKDPNNPRGADYFKELVGALKERFELELKGFLLKDFYLKHPLLFYYTKKKMDPNFSGTQFYGESQPSPERERERITHYLDNLKGEDRAKFIESSRNHLKLISVYFAEKSERAVEIPLYELTELNSGRKRFWYQEEYNRYPNRNFGIVFRVDGSHAILHDVEIQDVQ